MLTISSTDRLARSTETVFIDLAHEIIERIGGRAITDDSRLLETDPFRSALMGRVRQKGTAPELLVAKTLRDLGLGYRKNARDLPGSPDFVNRARRWAIFVNGCYWHHHSCNRGTTPARNREFWVAKFRTNRARDALAVRALRAAGYRVLLIWECECLDSIALRVRLATLPSSKAGAAAKYRRVVAGKLKPFA